MTEIQKLAALVFRLVGATLVFLVSCGVVFRLSIADPARAADLHSTYTIASTIFYISLGAVIVLFSKPLGSLFGRGL